MYSVADFYETKGDYETAAEYSRLSLEGFVAIEYNDDAADSLEQLSAFLIELGKEEEADKMVQKYSYLCK
jgi:hypothetical protein